MAQKGLTTKIIWLKILDTYCMTLFIWSLRKGKTIYGAKNQKNGGWLRGKGLLTVKCIIIHKDAGNVLCLVCMAVTCVHTNEKYKLYT